MYIRTYVCHRLDNTIIKYNLCMYIHTYILYYVELKCLLEKECKKYGHQQVNELLQTCS